MKPVAPREVNTMPPSCYREIRFPGYEGWNAIWDMHASGPFIYIPLCAEFPEAKSVILFRYDTRDGSREMILDADAVAGVDLSTGAMPQAPTQWTSSTVKSMSFVFSPALTPRNRSISCEMRDAPDTWHAVP